MLSDPKRIRRSRAKGYRLPPDAVYVGRPGPWGNPFVIGRDGTAAECVELYKYMLAGWFTLTKTPTIKEMRRAFRYASKNIDKLRGKNLACWCPLVRGGRYVPCHADVLLRIVNGAEGGTTGKRG